ncbi:hypothetical protein ACLOJK_014922 [Asimina triloba]
MGKVHGSLARAGKVRGQTPKVAKQDKKKKPRGRAYKRAQYNRRFVTAGYNVYSYMEVYAARLARKFTVKGWLIEENSWGLRGYKLLDLARRGDPIHQRSREKDRGVLQINLRTPSHDPIITRRHRQSQVGIVGPSKIGPLFLIPLEGIDHIYPELGSTSFLDMHSSARLASIDAPINKSLHRLSAQ